ncbi:DUF3489 domain-containing protein [Roseomonas rosulenta]|uniref:DUF3489 domain-containing protein n=1 Tax=Roseomonas rosulenta TaxID=2748667 RepID=UPI0018DFC9A7|nr:DUF3489 domain-containing protein [Roseomonas rosulenta]
MTKLSDTQRVILSRAAQHDALLATPPAKLPAAARQAVLRSMIGKGLLEEAPAPREAIGLGWRQDEDGGWIALRITEAGLAAIGVEPEASGTVATQGADDPEDNRPRDERNGVDPALVIGDLADPLTTDTAPAEMALLPAAPQGDSLAPFVPASPSTGGEAPEGLQRQPVSQHGPIGRAAALHMAAASVLAAWDAPERDGLDDSIGGLRDALAASPRAQRASRPARDPAAPRQLRTGTKQEAVLALLRRDEGTTIAEIIEATAWQSHTVRGFLAGLKRKGMTVEVLERVRQVGTDKQGAKGSYSIYRIIEAG